MSEQSTTQDAAAFAIIQSTAVENERAAGVRDALALILNDRPGKALYVLVRSVERQARIAGAADVDIQPLCPCGGLCEHGTAVTR